MYLFAFNYPNEDAVVYNAKKLDKYIQNLIQYVKREGNDEMKACFFASRQAYDCNDYKINLVAHSMGGLVSRYYIENLRQDAHVEKLITVDTPHWGSRYGDLLAIPVVHKLCDHDLAVESVMNSPDSNDTDPTIICLPCFTTSYHVTPKLSNPSNRFTKYYAIAGLDFELNNSLRMNDYTFEMPTDFTTYQQVEDFLRSKGIILDVNNDNPILDAILSIGDNLVSFLSQIGWKEDSGEFPSKRIPMEKTFVDVDTNGGNGGGIFIWELVGAGNAGKNILHIKVPHRQCICNKIIEYLEE